MGANVSGSTAASAREFMGSGTVGYAAQGVFDYSINYAAGKVAGLDTSFSWKNVAASAIGSAIGSNVSSKTDLTGSVARGLSSATSSAYLRDKWFGGSRPDYAQVAADAFGNAFADYVVRSMNPPPREPDPFFKLGQELPLSSRASFNKSNPNEFFNLDKSSIGNYAPSPDYLNGAYLADVDTSKYTGLLSTDQNPHNAYINLIDPYSSNNLSLISRNLQSLSGDNQQTIESIEGSFWKDAGKRFIRMLPIIGEAAFPIKTGYAEENSFANTLRSFIGGDDAIQNQADISVYDDDEILGVRHGAIIDAAEVALDVASAAKGVAALAKALGAIRMIGITDSLPEGLAYRIDLPDHLMGPDGFTKSGQLSGTHNLDNTIAALEQKAATYTISQTSTKGILELTYEYSNPISGRIIPGSKTVYDSKIISDKEILEYSLEAEKEPGQNIQILHLRDI